MVEIWCNNIWTWLSFACNHNRFCGKTPSLKKEAEAEIKVSGGEEGGYFNNGVERAAFVYSPDQKYGWCSSVG